MSAPAALASVLVLAGGEHGDAQRLARAMRHHRRATDLLVGLRGIDAEVHGTSTVSLNFAVANSCTRPRASSIE